MHSNHDSYIQGYVWKPRSAISRTTPISACGGPAPHADVRSPRAESQLRMRANVLRMRRASSARGQTFSTCRNAPPHAGKRSPRAETHLRMRRCTSRRAETLLCMRRCTSRRAETLLRHWDQLNFTVFTMFCKHSYSKMKSNEVM